MATVAAGSAVSDTIRKKIADVTCFEDDPALLMYGCFSVIVSVSMWLMVATYYEMPVSTTHSCVGGMVGMAIVAKGAGCVIWAADGTEEKLYLPQGVSAIVLSWVFSPLFSVRRARSLLRRRRCRRHAPSVCLSAGPLRRLALQAHARARAALAPLVP